MGRKLEAAIAVLNGAVGDYLARTGNGLATPMGLIHEGRNLAIDDAALSAAHPHASGRVAVLVHGLMGTEGSWRHPDGTDYGSLLARDLGITPLYVRYNSGRPIADNGALLAALLERLIAAYPVAIEEIVLIGYSMGGLVVRSACHTASAAEHAWLAQVRRAIYLATPHRGAPMERAGRVIAKALGAVDDPYARLLASLAELRSAGVKDLGDADLGHRDRARLGNSQPAAWLASIEHYLIAGALFTEPRLARWVGDAMVPLASATDGQNAASHVRIINGSSHARLARHPEVYVHLREWCAA